MRRHPGKDKKKENEMDESLTQLEGDILAFLYGPPFIDNFYGVEEIAQGVGHPPEPTRKVLNELRKARYVRFLFIEGEPSYTITRKGIRKIGPQMSERTGGTVDWLGEEA